MFSPRRCCEIGKVINGKMNRRKMVGFVSKRIGFKRIMFVSHNPM